MNVTQDLEIWSLIASASLVVKFVMALLLGVSFMSWLFIFRKMFAIRRARSETDTFEREFWGGNDLNLLYQGAVNNRHSIGSLERIFEAGFREFSKLRGQRGTDASTMVDGARRAMRATYQREMDVLESHLSFLASAGSVSPYVGLFGTVWGIMHAFRGLANVQQATLAQVAPEAGPDVDWHVSATWDRAGTAGLEVRGIGRDCEAQCDERIQDPRHQATEYNFDKRPHVNLRRNGCKPFQPIRPPLPLLWERGWGSGNVHSHR